LLPGRLTISSSATVQPQVGDPSNLQLLLPLRLLLLLPLLPLLSLLPPLPLLLLLPFVCIRARLLIEC
jgi:hypothetical protein